ncbi:MAG: transglutaminase-like domain-containing protein [Lachnospiraceae bacterium]|nr:transglutaminase-like domain-containing protein [Lachnospiraceae bacterium]
MIVLFHEIIYITVLSTGMLAFFMPFLGYEDAGLLIVILSALTASAPALFKKSSWMGKLVMTGVLIALIIAGVLLGRNESFRAFFAVHTEWVPVLVIAICAFFAGEISSHFAPARIVFSVLFAGGIIAAVALDAVIGKLLVVCVLAYVLLALIEEIQRRWVKSGYTDGKKHLVYVMVFVVLAMVPVLLLPAPDDPYDWELFKRIYKSVSESFSEFGRKFSSDGVYDPANVVIGFTGRGDLHGNVNHANDEAMNLIDMSNLIKGVRLDGRSFDAFDGMSWTDGDLSEDADELLDTVAFLATVNGYAENPDDYYRRNTFRISYEGISTPYVFTPLKSVVGRDGTGEFITYSGGDIIWADEKNVLGEYWVTLYRMNTANRVFDEMIESVTVPDREAFDARLEELSLSGQEGLTYEDYLRHAARIRELYTDAPEISDELDEYLQRIYEGADTITEKMNRLCRELASYEYTDRPGDMPEYVTDASSMLDYFMLESRRGYCSYFATAFVLLARNEGLPARYVQGYLVPTGGARNVTVYTYMAHAWPEVYYEGIGWIAYEPTPGMGTYDYWRTEAENLALNQGVSAGYPGMREEEEGSQQEAVNPEEEEEEKIRIPVRVIVIPIVTGLSFIVMFFIIGNVVMAMLFRKKSIAERFEILCRQDMNLLRILGFGITRGETLSEFEKRIGDEAGPELAEFVEDMTGYLYAGNIELEEPEIRAMKYKSALLSRLRKENFLKYAGFYLGLQSGGRVKGCTGEN